MIKQRRESGQRMNDLIDLMIDCIKDDLVPADHHHGEEHEEDQYEKDMKLHDKDGAGQRWAQSKFFYIFKNSTYT